MGGTSSSPTDSPDEESQKTIKAAIEENCVMIFSKTYCPYCKQAKDIFQGMGVQYGVLELDERSDGQKLQNTLANMTPARTVPRVFVNGKCIGGASETKSLHKSGELKAMLENCR